MNIDMDINVRPFFQVMVCTAPKDISAKTFFDKFKGVLSDVNNHATSHLVEILLPQDREIEDHFFSSVLRHRKVPTWYSQEEKIDLSSGVRQLILDQEFDLLIFYKKDNHYFFSTNCSHIFSLIQKTLDVVAEDQEIRFSKLTGEQLNLILSLFNIEYRSLGIQNHFQAGGTAPDGKTYHSKDASSSLTPSFDAGYGFSYCIGAMQLSTTKKIPFGCSKNKSKIWTTWVNDLDDFIDKCDDIVKWLTSVKRPNIQLDVLVQSTNKSIVKTLVPVEFFLDYYIMEKGMVYLAVETFSLDWDCRYVPDTGAVVFNIREDDVMQSIEINFRYDEVKETFTFSYVNSDDSISIAIAEDDAQLEKRRESDLVTFLNNQCHFTILFDKPYAYRDDECWQDNRLGKKFNHVSSEISWIKVDIRKESSPAGAGKKNILERVEEHFLKDKNLLFACNDNGANEIADYILVYESKIILIHAKYASDATPKLVIEDVQVVASQTVKNIRYFLPAGYDDEILERLYGRATKNKLGKFKKFKESFLNILRNKDIDRECWIVQPGVSLSKLKAAPENKMHTILNFVDSILRVNNVSFKLVASS